MVLKYENSERTVSLKNLDKIIVFSCEMLGEAILMIECDVGNHVSYATRKMLIKIMDYSSSSSLTSTLAV